MSNISVFIFVATAILLIVGLQGAIEAASVLLWFGIFLFILAGALSVRQDQDTGRDYFYGMILYFVIVTVVFVIIFIILKGQIISQVQYVFNIDISQYFNLQNYIQH